MMRSLRRTWGVVILVVIVLLTGCAVESDRSDKPSEDWSRGLLLGQTALKQATAMEVDASGRVHLVWCEITSDGADALHYARLEDGAIMLDRSLAIELPNPRRPQLLLDGDGALNLVWLSRSQDIERLYQTILDESGEHTEPLLVSREGEDVGKFEAYLSPAGELALLWSGRQADESVGISYQVLDDGAPPVELINGGIDPAVMVDRLGTVHMAWTVQLGPTARDVYYATLAGSEVATSERYRVSAFEFAESAAYWGPVVAADTDNVYVIWSVQNMGGGLTPTAAFAFYVNFEPGQAAFSHPRPLSLPSESRPEYAAHSGPYGYTTLAPLSAGSGSDFANAPATVKQQESELPVVLSAVVESTAESSIQLAMAVLDGGRAVGYELASKTPGASVVSSLVADSDLNLHLAWLDTAGFRQYDVYYATTAPAARSWLDRVSSEDLVIRVADTAWGIASGIGLAPIAAVWNFPPLIWVVLFYVVSGQEYLERRGARFGLAVAIVVYIGSKFLFMSGLAAGTPFLYRVPVGLASALVLGLPVVILALGLGALALYVRRSESPALFKAYLVFALTDGILTLVLYAPGLFNPS